MTGKLIICLLIKKKIFSVHTFIKKIRMSNAHLNVCGVFMKLPSTNCKSVISFMVNGLGKFGLRVRTLVGFIQTMSFTSRTKDMH